MKIILIMFTLVLSLFATVDINTATQKELTSLHGIGVKKAQSILKYRDSVKCFKSIDDLVKIKGIGKATILKNKEILKVSKCK